MHRTCLSRRTPVGTGQKRAAVAPFDCTNCRARLTCIAIDVRSCVAFAATRHHAARQSAHTHYWVTDSQSPKGFADLRHLLVPTRERCPLTARPIADRNRPPARLKLTLSTHCPAYRRSQPARYSYAYSECSSPPSTATAPQCEAMAQKSSMLQAALAFQRDHASDVVCLSRGRSGMCRLATRLAKQRCSARRARRKSAGSSTARSWMCANIAQTYRSASLRRPSFVRSIFCVPSQPVSTPTTPRSRAASPMCSARSSTPRRVRLSTHAGCA
jgi:hypothetical protein